MCTIVSDNGGLATAVVQIDVLSARQQINNAFRDVEALVAAGILNNGQGNALTSKLGNASKNLETGKTKTGINQLEAFMNQLEANRRLDRTWPQRRHSHRRPRDWRLRAEGIQRLEIVAMIDDNGQFCRGSQAVSRFM